MRDFIFSFNVFAGILLLNSSLSLSSRIFKYLGFVIIPLQYLTSTTDITAMNQILPALYIIFFLFMSIKLYRDIFLAKEIDSEMIAAVFSGFILLGFLTTFLYLFIEGFEPGSFRGIAAERSLFDNLLYFSFISLLTIGYGDIVPNTDITTTLTILVGIMGNFYTVIVTGIIIGKFVSRRNQ